MGHGHMGMYGRGKGMIWLANLSLNLNTEAKSGSAGSDVVVSEAVGVRVGVACYDRGLKNEGGGGVGVVELDVISRTDVA
nr:hypothetical protein [Tanacetum cinerariifolium]